MTVPAQSRPRVGRPRGLVLTAGRHAVRGVGILTAPWRPDPDFLVIGAKRGGTTSFYSDLLRHPQLHPLFPQPGLLPKEEPTKGIHYFDTNYYRGECWYRSYLPTSRARRQQERSVGSRVVVGEASPYYLFHPAAPARAHELLPHARLIVLLRDPTTRTYSHWKERRRSNAEELSFADALAAEEDRIGDAEERLRRDPHYYSYAHEQQSYASQSEYDRTIAAWLSYYPRDQLLVLTSEQYYRDPQEALDQAFAFLGLRPVSLVRGEVRNAAPGLDLDPRLRTRLDARFGPHIQRIRDLTGVTTDWLA